MSELHPNEAFRELVARGLIAAVPGPRPLPRSNRDRRADDDRTSWVAHRPDGMMAKITLGTRLAGLAGRQAAIAEACPGLIPAPLFLERLPEGEAFAEAFFDGFTLEAAVEETRMPPAEIRIAFERICSALAATENPSTEAARQGEWQEWSERLTGLAVWHPAEQRLLREAILPGLYPLLATAPPVTRWTNGDFFSANILLNPAGEARLIDLEFATRTHFFPEDAVRFNALSPAARRHPEVFAAQAADPGLPWHLYFWLRQLQLEAENNTSEYLARVLPIRLGSLRRLAEHVLRVSLEGWSTDAIVVWHALEETRWSQATGMMAQVSGWCYVPAASELRRVVALRGHRWMSSAVPAARADVQRHFSDEPRARLSGFTVATKDLETGTEVVLCAEIDSGALLPFRTLAAPDQAKGPPLWDNFETWAARNDPDPPAPALAEKITGPLISILLPVYDPPLTQLQACLESVRAQHYPRWELCLVDDGSSQPAIAACLQQFARTDPRVRVRTRGQNGGISRASNDALADATGEFVVLLDHDDLLRPHALAEFARRLEREPDLDVIYSDEDKITADGRRALPFLKPDFSPEFALGVMYVGHALCVRTSVARSAGGFDPVYDGVQDYEFFLRVSGHARKIGHVPRMLYHWRQSPASSALHGNVKGDMDEKQAAAVRAHLLRHSRTEQVTAHGGHRVQLHAPTAPLHEIVRPAPNEEPLAALRRAAAASRAEVFVLLTIEPQGASDNWLLELAALAGRPDSACVAPLLLARDGRVLESGWTAGPDGAAPVMRGFEGTGDGYNGSLPCSREVAAVSPLCVAVRRSLLDPSAGNATAGEAWLDFCTRLQDRGLFNRVCAVARVQVDQSWHDAPSAEMARPTAAADRFFNRHFDPSQADYRLRPSRAASAPQWHLDTTPSESIDNGCLLWRGWCFAGGGESIRAIRLRTANLTLPGIVGLPRPDVRAALPQAPGDATGFEIRGTLPAGHLTLSLEAQTSDGNWHVLMARAVTVKRQFIPRWLGGGAWTELMFFQMPAHMAYPARPVRPEKFPPTNDLLPQPKFSIVTPSFQQARFLGETMRSVLVQSGVACEYVVQDGGSTDGSVAVIKRFAQETASEISDLKSQITSASLPATSNPQFSNLKSQSQISNPKSPSDPASEPASQLSTPTPRLLAWASEPDQGQADAIVKGFARTSGSPDDIMAWLNSDDFYLPGTLPFVADYFARHPDVDMLHGHRIVVNEDSQEIARWFLPAHDGAVLRLNDFVPQETVFWRRRIWDKVGGLDPSFKFAMDWDLFLRFQSAGAKIVRVPFFLACFRVHPGQKTSAAMHDIGRREIDHLRARTNNREIPAAELEQHPLLLRYLRRSAFVEFLWKLGVRAP